MAQSEVLSTGFMHTAQRAGHSKRAYCGALAIAALLLLVGSASVCSAAEVTDENVAQSIATAKTPADHEALAAYFRRKAAAAAQTVKRHEAMLKSYEEIGGRPAQVWKPHCEALITSARAEQKEYEMLAAEHEKMAKEAAGK